MSKIRHALILLAGLIPTISALAGDLPNCPERPIRVGFFEFGLLFNSERGDKTGTGIDRDLIKELEKRSTCHFEWRDHDPRPNLERTTSRKVGPDPGSG